MNVSTFIVLLVVIAIMAISARYLIRTGPCGDCSSKGSCSGSCSKMPDRRDPAVQKKLSEIDAIIERHQNRSRRS